MSNLILPVHIAEALLKKKKEEGDFSTPKGTFKLGPVYYRNDRVQKPNTKLINWITSKILITAFESTFPSVIAH